MPEQHPEHPNVGVLRDAYDAFVRGDLEAYWTHCRDDFIFHVPGLSGVAGRYTGKEEFFRLIGIVMELTNGQFREEVDDVLANDRHGVVLAVHRFERYGMPKEYRTAHVYRIQDGKLAECWEQPENSEDFNEAWS